MFFLLHNQRPTLGNYHMYLEIMIFVLDSIGIQLIGGDSDSEGNVLLLNGGERGIICDDLWDDKDATVICKMLGYRYCYV